MSQVVRIEPTAVAPLALERFATVLGGQEMNDLAELAARGRELLARRVVWCVNSTARGGGVAEMLRSLLGYVRGAGIDARWMVLDAPPAFFDLTKRLHNRLHGSLGDGGALGAAERDLYDHVTGVAAGRLLELIRPDDVVILHDPQTAGMAIGLRRAGVHVVWRAHVGVDAADEVARAAWEFLRPAVAAADLVVFSRERFVWSGLDPARVVVIPPSIDVLSPKNQEIAPDAVAAILQAAGLVGGAPSATVPAFVRADGTPGRVDRRAEVLEEAPLRLDDRVVVQVSRWDRLKDPVGVVRGFVSYDGEAADAHLLLAGASTRGVADDPEGASALEEVTAVWRSLPPAARHRVHLASLPMEDVEENAAIVNALQRHAAVVVQKSLAEGFGLTAAEALWKRRPLVASGVGGLQDQVIDRVTGLLVDPRDLAGFGHAIRRLLADPALAERLGSAGHDHVRERYLEPRHLGQWVELVARLSAGAGHVATSAAGSGSWTTASTSWPPGSRTNAPS